MADGGGGSIARFEARRLFDEMRVALSRSTDKLVLLEPGVPPCCANWKSAAWPAIWS